MHRAFTSTLALSILTLASTAAADSAAVLTSPPGTTATVKITVTVTTALGTSSDDDTQTATTAVSASGVFSPTAPPFTAATYDSTLITFGAATFTFNLYCLPFIGCQTLNVAITDLTLEALGPYSGSIAPGGAVTFPDPVFYFNGNYSTTGVATSSGKISSASETTYTANISTSGNTVTMSQWSIANQVIVVPPDQLPSGVTALSFTVEPNLANTTIAGPFEPQSTPGDLNGDGSVGPADLGILLGSWGNPGCAGSKLCPADLNNDGAVGPADLGILLGNWG